MNCTWAGCGTCKHGEYCNIDNIYRCFNYEKEEEDNNEGLDGFPCEHI